MCIRDSVYDGTKLRSVIDGDTGAVVEASDYYPFGKRISDRVRRGEYKTGVRFRILWCIAG